MAIHRIHLPDLGPDLQGAIDITGPEAHHAVRVKRLAEGAPVHLTSGRGVRARGAVAGIAKAGRGEWVLAVRIEDVEIVPAPAPELHVFAAAPKGARLEAMIDELSQVGAASWAPLEAHRSVVVPRAGKLGRLDRVAIEAAKQCGRDWVLEVGEPTSFAETLSGARGRVVVADPAGAAFVPGHDRAISLLIGPEGGFTAGELDEAVLAGASVCRFGRHTMRVETAAVVAAGVIIEAAERYSAGAAVGASPSEGAT